MTDVILPYAGRLPKIHETAFVAPTADIIGDVEIGDHTSIWFQCVVRGDVHKITIGSRSNIQDQAMLHVTRGVSPLKIGNEVTVGHRVTLHGCTVGNRVLVGIGAIVLDDVIVDDDCLIGAGALVTRNMKIPSRSLVLGSPAKVVRTLTDAEVTSISESADRYVKYGSEYYGYVPGPERVGLNNSDLDFFSHDFDNS
jgi:gamma-carbonic anhydrase